MQATLMDNWVVILLAVIGALAVVVVVGMIFGQRQAAIRHRVVEAAEERAEEEGAELPPGATDGALPVEAPQPEPEPEPAPGPMPEPEPEPQPAPEPEPEAEPVPVPDPTPPVPEPAPPSEAAPVGDDRPLTTIKGLGPKVATMLAERGITRIDQVAALSDAEAATLDAALGAFAGRMVRDRWIEQAKLLTAGDVAAYEAAFGKLG